MKPGGFPHEGRSYSGWFLAVFVVVAFAISLLITQPASAQYAASPTDQLLSRIATALERIAQPPMAQQAQPTVCQCECR